MLTIAEAARVMGGTVAEPDPSVRLAGASIDTRTLKPRETFFAMKGEFLDGHDFVKEALLRGAAAAVVTRLVQDADPKCQILVADPVAAMSALARWVRDTVNPVVVGITGSSGKTSVKDLLASISSRVRPTVASQGSFNNELGLPLTLLKIRPGTEVVVCEMGARGPGQIKLLCDLARPHVGVVTNVGVTHYEMFRSREAIVAAKSELIEALPEGGAAVLNADDPLVSGMRTSTGVDRLTYGLSQGAWLRAENVRMDRLGRATFRMVNGSRAEWVSLKASGGHQVHNSLAAAAAALALGLSLAECRVGLEAADVSAWRMEIKQAGGVVIVNDAYNANPASVASALHTCTAMVEDGRRLVAVLGYMAELGELEANEHRQVGALAASTAQRLVVVGHQAGPIAAGAREEGLAEVVQVDGPDQVPEAIGDLQPGDVLLIKGSRVAALEKVADEMERRLAGA